MIDKLLEKAEELAGPTGNTFALLLTALGAHVETLPDVDAKLATAIETLQAHQAERARLS